MIRIMLITKCSSSASLSELAIRLVLGSFQQCWNGSLTTDIGWTIGLGVSIVSGGSTCVTDQFSEVGTHHPAASSVIQPVTVVDVGRLAILLAEATESKSTSALLSLHQLSLQQINIKLSKQ